VSEQQNRDALERFVQLFERGDLDAATDLLHDDYVEEYPQSGERSAVSKTGLASSRPIPACQR
jgi:ketosteroid isomerase-like protein